MRHAEAFRRAADSQIIINARRIYQGQMPQLRGSEPTSDFHFVQRDEPDAIATTLAGLVQERIPERLEFDRFAMCEFCVRWTGARWACGN